MLNLCKLPLFLLNILTAYHILFNALCYATTSPSTFIINNINVVNPETGITDKQRSVFIQNGIIKHITSSDSIRDINILGFK